LFDYHILESIQFNIPIISVGNITVGGTGKTPHVEYLIKILKDHNKLATLSRGYLRKTKGFLIADNQSTSIDIGDEPKQIKTKFPDITVAVDGNRVNGVKQLIKEGIDSIILDDAFQHRHIKPGLSILLVDYNRNINADHLLPFGRLRENVSAKDRADIIIVSKTPESLKPIDRRLIRKSLKPRPYQKLYFSGLKYGRLTGVFSNNVSAPQNWNFTTNIYSIVLVTGIASSKQLLNYLKAFSEDIYHLDYPDHAVFTEKRIKKIISTFNSIKNKKKIIITTEKDAVKIRELAISDTIIEKNMFYLPIEVFFIDENQEFKNQIIEYVKKDNRYR
jgi:tetraacyldisaccharide 4'-kinase